MSTSKSNRVVVAILMALLLLAAFVMWQNGELDAKASVLLLAFSFLGVALLLPRHYDYLCIGVLLLLALPIYGLLSGRVANLQGRRSPDIQLSLDEPAFWVMVVAWAAISIATIWFGVVRVRQHRRSGDSSHEA
jgi:Ca2+/Na+ antiporter